MILAQVAASTGMTTADIAAWGAVALALVAAIGAQAVLVLSKLRELKEAGLKRDETVAEIHVLAAGEHTEKLTTIASLTNEIASTTQRPGDIQRAADAQAAADAAAVTSAGLVAAIAAAPPPVADKPKAPPGIVVAGLCLALGGCAAFLPALHLLEVAACDFVPSQYGTVCKDAIPVVDAAIAALPGHAARFAVDPAVCPRAQITADGVTARGAVCEQLCGDMTKATAADPCPAVDALYRKQETAKAALRSEMGKVAK